jgi:nucleoside-diphosphate-sugar epimerase
VFASPPELDVRDTVAVRSGLAAVRPDVVVHLAAASGAMVHPDEPELVTAINAVGTVNVLAASERLGVRRVVLASSVAVVETPPGTQGLAPRSLYGATKQFGDTVAMLYRRSGLEVICARIGTVYGAARRTADLFSAMAEQARREGVIEYDPRGTEPLIEVRDTARVLAGLTALPDPLPEYDLVGEMRSHAEIAQAMGEELQCTSRPLTVPQSTTAGASGWSRPLDTTTVWADTGLRPEVPLERGIADYVAEHTEGLQPTSH